MRSKRAGLIVCVGLALLSVGCQDATSSFVGLSRHTRAILISASIGVTAHMACCARPASDMEGTKAPDFHAVNLRTNDIAFLEQYSGSVVVLSFLSSRCGQCGTQMESLERLSERFANSGLRVVAVNLDEPSRAGDASAIVDRLGLDFDVLLDPTGRIARNFNASDLPTTVLVDDLGMIASRQTGFVDWGSPASLRRIQSLIAKAAARPNER